MDINGILNTAPVWVFSISFRAQDSYVGSVERQHQEQWVRHEGPVAQTGAACGGENPWGST